MDLSAVVCYCLIREQLVMGPSPGPARARPGPVHFLGIGLKILRRAQAQDQFFEKGLEIWDFYVVKNRGLSRLEIKLL